MQSHSQCPRCCHEDRTTVFTEEYQAKNQSVYPLRLLDGGVVVLEAHTISELLKHVAKNFSNDYTIEQKLYNGAYQRLYNDTLRIENSLPKQRKQRVKVRVKKRLVF